MKIGQWDDMKRLRMTYGKKKTLKTFILYELGYERRFSRSVYKTPFKLKKEYWYDEYSDSDLFTPSCPHLHSVSGQYKLNVYTGEMYDIRLRKVVKDKRVPNKELKMLWENPEFLLFATQMRKIYMEKYPKSKLPDIPKF